jgi:hypothetical protein
MGIQIRLRLLGYAYAMRLCGAAILAFAVISANAAEAADGGGSYLLPAVGASVHYRMTRTAQGNSGARTAVSNLTLHRKSASTVTLQGIFGQPASAATTLTLEPGSTLESASAPAAESALPDVLSGLNRASEFLAGKSGATHDGWSTTVRLTDVRGANASVVVPVFLENVAGTSFEFHGVGQATVEPPVSPAAMSGAAAPGNYGIRRRRATFPGANPASEPAPGSIAGPTSGQAITVTLSVDGRVRKGSLSEITIVETRSVTIDSLPYVNVSGWTIAATQVK